MSSHSIKEQLEMTLDALIPKLLTDLDQAPYLSTGRWAIHQAPAPQDSEPNQLGLLLLHCHV